MHDNTARLEALVSAAQPDAIKRYSATTQEAEALLEDEDGDLVLYIDHVKDRHEGLAREADLAFWKSQAEGGWKLANRVIEMQREKLDQDEAQIKALQQDLAEAKKIMQRVLLKAGLSPNCDLHQRLTAFVASPGCADGE